MTKFPKPRRMPKPDFKGKTPVLLGIPSMLRMSRVCKALRESGEPDKVAAAKFIEESVKLNADCPVHGLVADPIVTILPDRSDIAFGCPWCSGDDVRIAWEAEGNPQS